MPFLIAAVVFVGALCAVDLLLTFAVIRRLAEHSRKLAEGAAGAPSFPAAGTKLGDFASVSADGVPVSADFFTGPTVVGVFSTNCSACHERLPEFTDFLDRNEPEHAIALVVGEEAEAREFAGALPEALPVVIEDPRGQLARALRVPAFPSFYLVDQNASIVGAAGTPDALPQVSNA